MAIILLSVLVDSSAVVKCEGVEDLVPAADASCGVGPVFLAVDHGEVEDFECGLLVRVVAAASGRMPESCVERLDRVGRVMRRRTSGGDLNAYVYGGANPCNNYDLDGRANEAGGGTITWRSVRNELVRQLNASGLPCGFLGNIARKVGIDLRNIAASIEKEGWSRVSERLIKGILRSYQKRSIFGKLRKAISDGIKILGRATVISTIVATACRR